MLTLPTTEKPSLAIRAPLEQVLKDAERFEINAAVSAVMDAIPGMLLVLNQHRQVVYANRHIARLLGFDRREQAFGHRPGELLDCEHVVEGCHGCGTSEACSTCGAAKAIRSCELGAADVQECRIHQKHANRALDLRVSATPLRVNDQTYSVLALHDVSDENRRRSLERIFFHDVLNTLGALAGYVQLLEGAPADETEELTGSIIRLTETLAEEIRAQRDLSAAENGDLGVRRETINGREVVEQVVVQYRNHPAARGKSILVGQNTESFELKTDRRLLNRIISNLVKNGLEAISTGQTVTVSCARVADKVAAFRVHNPGSMPRDVQLQIFQRAFSTKGVGRGLGTYSVRLLGEKYLNGRAHFTSTPEEGTTFHVELPAE